MRMGNRKFQPSQESKAFIRNIINVIQIIYWNCEWIFNIINQLIDDISVNIIVQYVIVKFPVMLKFGFFFLALCFRIKLMFS